MPVEEVQDDYALAPNRVYVISPNQQLQLTDTIMVSAHPFSQPRGQRAPIDTFFRSLAKQYGDGFAIILSGSGSDGAVGVKAIKEQGGLILVQTPTEARFDGMPRAAIATGMADFVLPVRQLAQHLPHLIQHKSQIYERLAAETQRREEESALRQISAHLQKKIGHDFSNYKRPTILRRLARRMQIQHQQTLNDYLNFLRQTPEGSQALFEELLISVTSFFRDPEAWETLRKQLIPRLFEEKAPYTPLRVWVPGYATGEEAYTLAILLLEETERRSMHSHIQIFATDLDEGTLATARAGYYPAAIEADLSKIRPRQYFRAEGNHYRISGIDKSHRLFQGRRTLGQAPPLSHLPAPLRVRPPALPSEPPPSPPAQLHRKLLEELALPSLLVDERRQVIHLSDTVGRFLQPAGGLPSQDITALVRPALQAELSTALYRVFEKGDPSLSPFTPVQFNGALRRVAILVQPRPAAKYQEKMALVIFLEGDEEEQALTPAPDAEPPSPPRVRQLQEELRQARAQLHTRREEAEINSEDLRAANEELQTVNNELKSKLEEISRAHSDLENLMAATEISTLFLDRRLCIHRFTPPTAKLFSITAHDHGRLITDFSHRLNYHQLETDAQQVLRDLIPIEHEAQSEEGRWYQVRLRPYRNGDDQIDGVLVTLVDITTRKHAEDELRRLNEEMARQTAQLQAQDDQQKDEFLSLLGHELRNPLAVIYNTTEVLKHNVETNAPDVIASKTVLIRRQVEHLLRLVDDLLNLTRINHGRIELKKKRVKLRDIVAHAVDLVRPQMKARDHHLELALPDSPVYVEADPDRLHQIVANLLSNAGQYTKVEGHIGVTVRQTQDKALIQIRDSGIGFTPEQLPQLFKPFSRLQSPADHHQGGLGLGLNLARKLAELHGGGVEGFSAGPGQGSEFTVRLPALPAEQASKPAPVPAEAAIPPQVSRRILLVEDDKAVADSLAILLQLQGHEVRTLLRGGQTLEAVQAFQPEVVLLDIGLPDMDGYQVARRLRQEPGLEALPLVALTGYGQSEDLQRAEAAGFNRHLLKPATVETLQKLLGEL